MANDSILILELTSGQAVPLTNATSVDRSPGRNLRVRAGGCPFARTSYEKDGDTLQPCPETG